MNYDDGALLKHRWNGLDEVYVLLGVVPGDRAARLGHMALMGNRYAILGRWDAESNCISTHSVEETDLFRCYEEVTDG